jgi:transposase
VAAGRLNGAGAIGVRAGKVADKYKVAKHLDLSIAEASFTYKVNAERIAAEAALDGLYVIRTSVAEADMGNGEAVRNYKRLAEVERAFRTLKGIDLQVRPIRHRLEERVKTHIFLSMLAYYVQWHMIEAWAPLTFKDETGDETARLAIPSPRRGGPRPRSPR